MVGLLALVDGARHGGWPTPATAHAAAASIQVDSLQSFSSAGAAAPSLADPDISAIQAQSLCIASGTWSFGSLGETVLFVHQRSGDQLRVGYFVYFDVERPWGKNLLTYSVLPAALIDATYSHLFFVLPGAQRLLYGRGDVEGASVLYDVAGDGTLSVREGLADDEGHRGVRLSREDLAGSEGQVVLMTNVWSHQLGAHGAAAYARSPNAQVRCFSGKALQPLSDKVAENFRLGSFEHPLRARPAFYRDRAPSVESRLARAPLQGAGSP